MKFDKREEKIAITFRLTPEAKAMLDAESEKQSKKHKYKISQNAIINALIKTHCSKPKK